MSAAELIAQAREAHADVRATGTQAHDVENLMVILIELTDALEAAEKRIGGLTQLAEMGNAARRERDEALAYKDRLRGEVVGSLAKAGISTLAGCDERGVPLDPTGHGEASLGIGNLARERDEVRAENLALHLATVWHDPKLEPPDPWVTVILLVKEDQRDETRAKGPRVMTGYLAPAGSYAVFPNACYPSCDVLRWMSLPAAPEVKP